MRLPGILDRLYCRKFGSFTLDDPRPIKRDAPYTFYLPSEELLCAVQIGDWVKAIFRPTPENRNYDAERMWVKVERLNEDTFYGILDSEPFDMPQLRPGMPVEVPRPYVIDIDWSEGKLPPSQKEHRTYWDRCLVDDCVVEGRSCIDYLYRETPDMPQEGDKFSDSGWRIRGFDEAIADDEAQGRPICYVAIGKVLNQDDRWLHLIDEPIGSSFRWNPEAAAFEAVAAEEG